ncbi:endonuclease domain-containing protein [Pseudoclavibacter sp. 13-3]|uniref:endonuclease domain-containing protein n=1 Tax=Pseudoclavibacter sp. 13-3 TaxID=2901228 RepID=UPI001E60FEA7|nr:endonuclease domain-containing protein [Pseudoclavibacter sp. 13-3]MCD7101409.1 endonuclease domain-containing protein [Pseudoclavibacter sp. 13-3]
MAVLSTPFGVSNAHALARAGISRRRLDQLVRRNELVRLRPGWFATIDANAWVVAAVKLGGHLSGLHRLKLLHKDIWLPAQAQMHLHVNTTLPVDPAAPHRLVRTHTHPRYNRTVLQHGVVPPVAALRHGLNDVSMPETVAVVDSLLRHATLRPGNRARPHLDLHVSTVDVIAELRRTPRGRAVLALVDAQAESGLESIARVLLALAGHQVEAQVLLDNRQRIDLVIDGVLAIELNGGTHRDAERFRRDHEKDLAVERAGYVSARYTYHQILYQWPEVYRDILSRLARA